MFKPRLVGRVTGFLYLHLYSALWEELCRLNYVKKTYPRTVCSWIIVGVFLRFRSKQNWPRDSSESVATWSLSPYQELSILCCMKTHGPWTFSPYMILSHHDLIIWKILVHHWSHQKTLPVLISCQIAVLDKSFPKFWYSLVRSKFYHSAQILPVVFLKEIGSRCA